MTTLLPDEAAIVAAWSASEAATELLRFAREGRFSGNIPFSDDVVGKLADAMLKVIDIEGPSPFLIAEERELLAAFRAHVAQFIEGW
ncbi:hypothetical protein [Sphingopyxis sp. FD7]|uniref:hypothetical protein n=1 Tax=Sphingopyxis sp. FD7 TaxID=1914525 RepID=UPI000DC61824|nr:hypothetical protein [Sphingopyxis sp. FD7]BBB13451.1 hypothetical protein SPYCA_2709 [Sphingopyxis sp. FD7]